MQKKLGNLFDNTSSDGIQGGKVLSANITLTIPEAIEKMDSIEGKDYDIDRKNNEKVLGSLIDGATRNEKANHIILTGKMEDENGEEVDYKHPKNGEINTADVLETLYTYDWKDDGKELRGLTDWIARDADSDDPEEAKRAGEAAASLIESMVSTNERFVNLTETGHSLNGEDDITFTRLNPEIADSYLGIYSSYIEDFSHQKSSDDYSYKGEDLEIPDRARVRFMQFIAGDEDSRETMVAETEAYRMSNIVDYENMTSGDAYDAASRNGKIQALIDSSLTNEAMDRENSTSDAEESLSKSKANGAKMFANAVISAIQGGAENNPIGGAVAEAAKSIAKDSISMSLDNMSEETKSNVNEYEPIASKDAGTAKRNFALQLLSSMEKNGDIEMKELEDKGLTTKDKNGMTYVMSGEHEQDKDKLGDLDSGINQALEGKKINFSDREMNASEYFSLYKESHGNKYDEVTDRYRARNKPDYENQNGIEEE
ncbi:hypothetical protein FHX37_2789 [Haloactinospora alba]|uniref:TPR repeat domain-containing protein n=2 Tax=Haloactinospora alba TaxID=405555 RepID=A0A543NLV4_9ACTN|nr:hypothetical protein FHX37_2789 [Haloactinospora alba]